MAVFQACVALDAVQQLRHSPKCESTRLKWLHCIPKVAENLEDERDKGVTSVLQAKAQIDRLRTPRMKGATQMHSTELNMHCVS